MSSVRASIVWVRIVDDRDFDLSISPGPDETVGGSTYAFVLDLDVVLFFGEIRPRPR